MARQVQVYFYGSFIIPSVRARHGFAARPVKVARLAGFDVRMDPITRIVRDDRTCVYGVVASASHQELRTLYSAEWMDRYEPEPVIVELGDGSWLPTLTYLPDLPVKEARAEAGYKEALVAAGTALGFPSWYVDRIQEAN